MATTETMEFTTEKAERQVRLPKLFAVVAIAFTTLVSGMLLPSSTDLPVVSAFAPEKASAATGNVDVIIGNWNCKRGGTVKAVQVSIDRGGETNWTSGSNHHGYARKVSLWTQKNVRVEINANIYCHRSWWQGGGYYQYSLLNYRYIHGSKTFI